MSEEEMVCPECNSKNIGQFRQIDGLIWGNDCGFRVESKEIFTIYWYNYNIIRYREDIDVR